MPCVPFLLLVCWRCVVGIKCYRRNCIVSGAIRWEVARKRAAETWLTTDL